ncbi:MAG TPA: glycosyltransferase [Flavobacterium sp.]|nr:glycosyltransferase [Flavobacterium sp.]
MKFLIVSNAPLIIKQEKFFAYSPYVKEMGIWAKYADEVALCCPQWKKENDLFVSEVPFVIHTNFWLSDFNIKSVKSLFKAFFQIIYNFLILFRAMIWADHIHLRCPGNVGLLASIAQIFFFWKIKTAKYAGNWDPDAKQPWTYKLQRWLLSNKFLTRNMQVLVYGEWPNQTKNIKPFFTATYSENDANEAILQRDLNSEIQFLFVGTLTKGKRPLYAIQLFENLIQKGYNAKLAILGEGKEMTKIKQFCQSHQLEDKVTFYGNKELSFVKEMYRTSHFLILPSKSEGWPKVVAEAMFWGCVPLSTVVSCVPFMLGNEKRGLVLSLDVNRDGQQITDLLNDSEHYHRISNDASDWSRQYTTDYFEKEIAKLVKRF